MKLEHLSTGQIPIMASKKQQDGDERFLRVQKDPRFWEMPDRQRKVKIDKRFKSMFHDKRFKVTYTVDKRGRPINHTSTEDLKRFYQLSDSEEELELGGRAAGDTEPGDGEETSPVALISEEEDVGLRDRVTDEGQASSGSDEGSGSDSDEDSGPDLARGKGNVETSSDEEEEDVDALLRQEEEQIEHDWGELSKDAVRSDQVRPVLRNTQHLQTHNGTKV